jgi:hypothetical protein
LCGKEPQKWSVAEKGVKRQKDFVNGKRRFIRTFIVVTKEKQGGSYVEIFPHNFLFILLSISNLFSN